jgi:hypothetical protein
MFEIIGSILIAERPPSALPRLEERLHLVPAADQLAVAGENGGLDAARFKEEAGTGMHIVVDAAWRDPLQRQLLVPAGHPSKARRLKRRLFDHCSVGAADHLGDLMCRCS